MDTRWPSQWISISRAWRAICGIAGKRVRRRKLSLKIDDNGPRCRAAKGDGRDAGRVGDAGRLRRAGAVERGEVDRVRNNLHGVLSHQRSTSKPVCIKSCLS